MKTQRQTDIMDHTDHSWAVSDMPSLQPKMLFPRLRRKALFFPFDHPDSHYFHFARNGLYALGKHWRLDGQEVLFPSYFHGVELEALLAAGVRPRFYPVDRFMNVDPDTIIERITTRTRAVYLIHYLGFPAPVERVREICQQRGLKLIEDCALALFSSLGPRPLGSFGDASVFCLYKTLPVPTGGSLCLHGETARFPVDRPPMRTAWSSILGALIHYYQENGNKAVRTVLVGARQVGRLFARATKAELVAVGGQHFEIERASLGMNRVNFLIIRNQDPTQIILRRRHNFQYLLDRLSVISDPVFRQLPEGVCPLFYPLRVPHSKAIFHERLRQLGVGSVNFWSLPHDTLPEGEFPDSDALRHTILELPCHQDLDDSDMEKIVGIVLREWQSMYADQSQLSGN